MYTPDKLIRITTVPISMKVLLKKQLRFMSDYFDVIAVSSPGDTLDEVRINEGVRIASVQMTRKVTPILDLIALSKLYLLFRKERPGIVHTHTPKAGLLGILAARMAGVPICLHTVAGLPLMEHQGIKRVILVIAERVTYRFATRIYPNSSKLAEFIIQNKYCKPDKVKVLGNGSSNGIDMDYYKINADLIADSCELRKELQILDSDFVFIFVGRVVKDKGIEELVEAFIQLKKSYFNIKLLIVGASEDELNPLSSRINEIIDKSDDIIRVKFQNDIRPYIIISHVLTFPSYREGFPNVPMQAGCLNVPCIVTDINGCNEIIEHKKNGLIIPVKSVCALKDSMELLMTDQALYSYLKSNARKIVQERYEQKHFWNLLLTEYQYMINKHEVISKVLARHKSTTYEA